MNILITVFKILKYSIPLNTSEIVPVNKIKIMPCRSLIFVFKFELVRYDYLTLKE